MEPATTIPNSLGEDLDLLVKRIIESASQGDVNALNEWQSRLSFLSQKEKDSVLVLLSNIKESGNFDSLNALWEIDFDHKPVSIDEFINNPYYLGEIGRSVYPIWKEELKYVCDPRSEIVEWIITGSLSCGKTYAGLLAELYKGPYYCSCLKDPQRYFGIAPGSDIVFGLFNRAMDNAAMIDFDQMLTFIDSGKYFKEKCPRQPISGMIVFPTKSMYFRVGSKELHALGSNLFGYLIDEVNFMIGESDPEGQANQLYNHTRRRMEGRFRRFGITPGLAVIISSRKSATSFLESHMNEMREQKNTSVHISDYALWDIKGRHLYSPKTFRVAIGDEYKKSRILDEVNIATSEIIQTDPCPLGQRFVEVPLDFYSDFRRDIEGSLRDHAGIPTFGTSPLIQRIESVHECIDSSLFHPFQVESATLSTENPDADLIQLVEWDKITKIIDGSRVLLLHPEQPRFMHIDLALSGDAAGIACAHPHEFFTYTRYDPVTNQVQEEFQPKVYIDFMLQVVPTVGAQIDIQKIVSFILNLRNWGFNLMRVTFDGFQSAMAIQQINHAGQLPEYQFSYMGGRYNLESQVLSVDRNDTAYTVLRDHMNYGAIRYYNYKPFLKEIVRLEHKTVSGASRPGQYSSNQESRARRIVDHPVGGAKDVSDAVCGSLYNVVTSKISMVSRPSIEIFRSKIEADDIQTVTDAAVLGDYKDIKRVIEIVPQPTPDASNTHRHLGNRGNLIDELARMGRFNK